MWDYLQNSPAGTIIVGVTVVAVVTSVGFFVLAKLRGYKDRRSITAGELLANFQEIREQGGLNDAEYRNIKTLLSTRMEDERKEELQRTARQLKKKLGGA